MTISFSLEYHTRWGENLVADVCLCAGRNVRHVRLSLSALPHGQWHGQMTLPEDVTSLSYRYCVEESGVISRSEWRRQVHRLDAPLPQVPHLIVQDCWHDRPENSYLLSSSFTQVFSPRVAQPAVLPHGGSQLTWRLYVPQVPMGWELYVLGNQGVLGHWQQNEAVRLIYIGEGWWQWTLPLDACCGVVEYKYLVKDGQGNVVMWEQRENRLLEASPADSETHWLRDESPLRLPFTPWRGAGTVIPVFSLRSEKSFGIGDFGDLLPMVDWLSLTGQHMLQLLPINDTTQTGRWTDSYPYNAISIYALHPIYLCLHALPVLNDEAKVREFECLRQQLNALEQVDYDRVMQAKTAYMRLLFRQEGAKTQRTTAYKRFVRERREWLLPYAAFCVLRDRFHSADPTQWGAYAIYRSSLPATLMRDSVLKVEMQFYCYVQYYLHEQLMAASRYARQNGVALKGDIPIGISRHSVEAWTKPDLFDMNSQAGAPPDAFSQLGQNWGFPTYNWERMLEDNCQWWRARFHNMAQYFDAYRIDHVLGFFRIWSIPSHSVHGLLGQFQPALPLSVAEIEDAGLVWDAELFTVPFITDEILLQLFADDAPLVRHRYLEPQSQGRYKLKDEVSTQRKVEALWQQEQNFDGHGRTDMTRIRDGLYTLISNVLFVQDNVCAGCYHPRIAAQKSMVFAALGTAQQQAFNTLYEDFYYHRHNIFWYEQAMRKLPLLCDATPMLVCAEDLGMVPQSVPWVLDKLDILSLEIQSMPKQPFCAFGRLWENPYTSVATISTHDMPTLRQWWEEDWERTQRFFNEALYRIGPAPHPLPAWLAEGILKKHLESPSMLALFSFQDWMSFSADLRLEDDGHERINVPANPQNYWRYRMHLSLERLIQEKVFNQHLHRLIAESGR